MHKSKNERQHASNISYYASYSIFIDIYSDFVPFHPALPYTRVAILKTSKNIAKYDFGTKQPAGPNNIGPW